MNRLATLAVFALHAPAAFAADAAYEAAPITVTARPRPSPVLTAPASVTVVEGRKLERERAQSVMQTIANAPGVSVNTTGAGIAKPVVRGLTSQRVLTLTDGVRQEGQQWGDEHGPEVDGNDLERIEIVRGPQGLLYGPEALSGVINLVRRPLDLDDAPARVGGIMTLDAFSHNAQGAGALTLRGEGRGMGGALRAAARSADDIRTAHGRLRNSGMEEKDFGGSLGVKRAWGTVTADYSWFDQRLNIHKDPVASPDATTFQRVGHQKGILRAQIPVSVGRLEATGGWQRNERREFEAATDPGPKARLVLDSVTSDLKFHHDPVGGVAGSVGLSAMTQRNATLGSERLIPGYVQRDFGGFVFEELALGAVTLSGGARYDARELRVKEEGALSVVSQRLRYTNMSGALGASWAFAEGWALAGNFGTGWRAPSAFELFVNGEHEGTGRFEVGRADLRSERSLNADLSLRRSAGRVRAELTGFHNRINHFIFAEPTGGVDAGSGLPIFQIRQANATLIGAEAALTVLPIDWLETSLGVDVVQGRNDDLRQPLPQMPSNRLKWGLRATRGSLGTTRNAYISASGRLVARQTKVAPNETQTAGYGLVDFGVGAELPFTGGEVRADLGVENAFDLPYRDHLSRYRTYALNAGRSVTLKLSVPFGAK